jgi:serine/threonine protein kinase
MLGHLLDGRYKIDRVLGAGGFGQTFIAKDIKTFDAICVVKLLKPAANDSQTIDLSRRMFATEARLLYELGSHDQIPRLFANFEEDQNFYLVQEHIQGHPLSEELLPDVQLPEQDVIRLVIDILEPLAYVHQNKVIHRDIKPPNLMRRSSDGKLVLIDFGSVKQIQNQVVESDGQTRMTVAIGTHGYMPTEQGAGEPELSSDIYAVGMIALQALTGIMPYKLPRNSEREICWQENISTSTEFSEFLDKMIRYDCRQRYQSALEALETLRNFSDSNRAECIDLTSSSSVSGAVADQPVSEQVLYTPTGYSKTVFPDRQTDLPIPSPKPTTKFIQEKGENESNSALPLNTDSLSPEQAIGEADKAYLNGVLNIERGDLAGALEEFNRAINYNSNNWKAYQERGKIFQMMRNYQKAEQDFQSASIKRANQNKGIRPTQSHNLTQTTSQTPSASSNSILQNVRNTLTRPIEGPRTLGVTVFGPRGVGKTSLLAAMYDQFGRTTQGTALQLTAELVTSAILQDYVAKLKSPFNTEAELEVMPGIQGTAETQDFVFDLGRTGGPAAIKLHFKDFPGGRIGATAQADEILEVKSLLETCAVVLVVIDAPALMEENGKWHDLANKPMLITDYFKTAYQNLKSPRLVLFVPSKCEKYIQSNPNMLLARVRESYAPLLSFFKDPSISANVVVAVTPIQTLGNMTLSHIDAQMVDGQLHPRFYYQKTAKVYAPKDSEQPLRYLLKFLLKLHLQKRTLFSKAIRSVLGSLFEDTAFKSTVHDFTRHCKTSHGFAVLQDENKWLDL